MLKCGRHLFSIEDHIHYLNNAYMSPNLKSVEVSGIVGVRAKSQPYRVISQDFFEPVDKLKQAFSNLINCTNHHHIAIVPSASYGLANVAANLTIGKKKKIIVPGEQFPSNYYVWERLAKENNLALEVISPPSYGDRRSSEWNEAILNAIDKDTLLVACGHVHWADGTLFNLQAFRSACDENDAYLIIDGSQSIGALAFDVQKIKPDALVTVGYKWLFGPYGIGFAYYNDKFLKGLPIEENWTIRKRSDDFKNLVNYNSEYRPGAARYSVGEHSNFILVPMMHTALTQLQVWTVEGLQAYSTNLIDDYLNAFKANGCFIEESSGRCNHILGVKLPDHFDMKKLSLALKERNVHISLRGKVIRLATSIYNSRSDLDAFLSAMHSSVMV
ncbi:aminotransferase class V-fold PLP-dependent enzyme [Portibacter marinus]|uniref:aminotransferase class V-fold PLP-dependent enzyme n=1 Tax=Portibacter marinus TaxID=2898660 RepID=UPI001F33C6B1|nr:aminotransferase class V-fold PLP-dependent enzyme [Portibacter marinus]